MIYVRTNIDLVSLGISVDGVSLTTKKVTLKGFNGLKGGVRIKSFDLPSNDPAGGIHLTLEATTANVKISISYFSSHLTTVLALSSWYSAQSSGIRDIRWRNDDCARSDQGGYHSITRVHLCYVTRGSLNSSRLLRWARSRVGRFQQFYSRQG